MGIIGIIISGLFGGSKSKKRRVTRAMLYYAQRQEDDFDELKIAETNASIQALDNVVVDAMEREMRELMYSMYGINTAAVIRRAQIEGFTG